MPAIVAKAMRELTFKIPNKTGGQVLAMERKLA